MIFLPMVSKHCNTDGRSMWIARWTMLKNELQLVIFHKRILISLWTFQMTVVYNNNFDNDIFYLKLRYDTPVLIKQSETIERLSLKKYCIQKNSNLNFVCVCRKWLKQSPIIWKAMSWETCHCSYWKMPKNKWDLEEWGRVDFLTLLMIDIFMI